MKNKYVFTAVLLAVILFVGNMLTMAYVRTEQSREQLKEGNLLVVTSFYPMYVAAENVIGDVEGVTLEHFCYVVLVQFLRINPFDIYSSMLEDSTMF